MSLSTISKHLAREPAWIVFCLTSIYFLLQIASGVLWMDVGELTTAAFNLGGAHPPGHPGHTLLGKLATLLPIGEVATRLSLMSALLAAATCAVLCQLTLGLFPKQRLLACLVVLPMAFSPALLINATRPEVYTATFALLTFCLLHTLRFCAEPHRSRDALLAVFTLALAATFHPAIAVTCALPLTIALLARAGKRAVMLVPCGLLLTLLAALVYLYLPVRALAATPPDFMWGDPSTTKNMYDLITASVYQGNFAGTHLVDRLAHCFGLLCEGSGFILCLAGYAGLGFGTLTRLRGAALLLILALLIPLAAALQATFNPDMRAYLAMTYVPLSLGLAIVSVALTKMLPSSFFNAEQRRWASVVAIAPILIFAWHADAGDIGELDDSDDAMQLWDETVGGMPPGPGIFFAKGDHLLFVAQYEALISGARPDIVIANPELVRDRWFLDYLRRRLPAEDLYLPYLDDGQKGQIAERLYWENTQRGRPVWADALNPIPVYERAVGRAFALLASAPSIPPEPPSAPLAFSGYVGKRVAGLVAIRRAQYELKRGSLAWAALAAGISNQFTPEQLRGEPVRPALLPHLPIVSQRFLYEEFERDLLTDDIRWQLGLDRLELSGSSPEQQIHFAWRLLLSGQIDKANAAIRAIGKPAKFSTTPMLIAIGALDLAEDRLRRTLTEDASDVSELIMLASLLGNSKTPSALREAEQYFEQASKLEPGNDEIWVRLGLIYAKLGKSNEARIAWLEARRLAPTRLDVERYLERLLQMPDTTSP